MWTGFWPDVFIPDWDNMYTMKQQHRASDKRQKQKREFFGCQMGFVGPDTFDSAGNHIRLLIRKRTCLSHFQWITCGLRAKRCCTDTQTDIGSYAETIYT